MKKARIQIVEDEAIIAMEIESQLQGLGYEVTSVVKTGDKAIEKAEEDKPDLILMDIRIQSDKDGIETAEIIREEFSIPVVFSTAYLDEERIERAKITMPFGYVLKPIQERDLKVTIEMALYVSKVDAERRKTEKELQKSEKHLKDIINSISSSFHVFDVKTKIITQANTKAGKDMVGKTCHLATHNSPVPCNTKEHPCPIDIILKTKKPAIVEHVHIWPDGSERLIEIHASPLFDDDGEVEYIVESNIDIMDGR